MLFCPYPKNLDGRLLHDYTLGSCSFLRVGKLPKKYRNIDIISIFFVDISISVFFSILQQPMLLCTSLAISSYITKFTVRITVNYSIQITYIQSNFGMCRKNPQSGLDQLFKIADELGSSYYYIIVDLAFYWLTVYLITMKKFNYLPSNAKYGTCPLLRQ